MLKPETHKGEATVVLLERIPDFWTRRQFGHQELRFQEMHLFQRLLLSTRHSLTRPTFSDRP